jgi:threonylcarbamoyladenosine tRNA methylthiotransferase MtaB
MNRHYTTEQYRQIVNDIRQVFDNAAITTDVMVGFAGETDEEFERSVRFVESIGFAKVHVFPYSRRPGTSADRMDGQIDEGTKKRRAAVMAQAAERSRQKFLKSQVGRTEPVLLETRNENGMYEGYTPNYTPVLVKAQEDQVNTVVSVKLTSVCGDRCEGQIL